MKAIQVEAPGAPLTLVEIEVPTPRAREVLIRVEACGVCHGDAIPGRGGYPGLSYPRVPGHEVVGIVAEVGSAVTAFTPGDRVGVGWSGGWCMECDACAAGDYDACEDPWVTGLSVDGGYAEYMVARSSALVTIPEELDSVDAAPLLCAGGTTFSALKDSGAKGGDVVAIHGIGGLGHLAIQYAARLGYTTVALSRGRDKEELARKLGAHEYIDTEAEDAAEALQRLGGAKVILATAPNAAAISGLVSGLGHDGTIIIVAAPSEPLSVHSGMLFRGDRSIKGWHGRRPAEALDFSVRFGVMPMVETFALDQAPEAFDRMMTAKARFRSVLTIS